MAEQKTSDYSLFNKTVNTLNYGNTASDPKTSMFDAPGGLGGALPFRPGGLFGIDREKSESVLTGETEVRFDEGPRVYGIPVIPGAKFVTMRKNILDESERDDIVSVQEAYKAAGYDVEGEAFKQMIMGATGFSYKDRDGIPDESGKLPTKRVRFAKGQSYESRIETMNFGRALTLDVSQKNRNNVDVLRGEQIPYSAITDQFTTTTKDLDEYYFNANPFSDRSVDEATKWDFFMTATFDNEVLNVGMARNFVKTMRNNGFSERNIAGIMKHRFALPTAGGFGAGDVSNLRGVYTDVFRFPVEAAGYVLGEALDALTLGTSEYAGQYLGPFAATAEDREEFLERVFPRMPGIILDRMDQLGLDLTYADAERLARMYSGPGTKALALAAEVAAAAGAVKVAQKTMGKREIELFKKHAKEMETKYPDMSPDDILQSFKTTRETQIFGKNMSTRAVHDGILNIPYFGAIAAPVTESGIVRGITSGIGTASTKINGLRTSSALRAGMQLEEAALSVSQRPEVRRFVKFRNDKRSEIIGIQNRASQEGRTLTKREQDRIDKLRLDVSGTERQLRRIVADSEAPPFMRNNEGLDTLVVLGGTGAYLTGQHFGGDEMLWEFFGSMGGLALYGTKSMSMNAGQIMRSMYAGRKDITTLGDLRNAERLAGNLMNFDETFREAVLARVEYFNGLTTALRQEGIPQNVLDQSSSRIIRLSVVQVIEEGLRVGINAQEGLAFKGDLELMELNRSMQQELVQELRGLFVRLKQNENAVKSGTATNKLFLTVQAAIENAEGKIRQLDDDLVVLNGNYEQTVTGMIEGTSKGLSDRIAPDAEQSMAEVFDRLNTFGVGPMTPENANAVRAGINKKAGTIADSIAAQARQTVVDALPTTTETAKDTTAALLNTSGKDVAIPKGIDPKSNLPLFRNPSDLLALLLESTHAADKANAAIPYKSLDNQVFKMRDPSGNLVPVYGKAFSDGGQILDDITAALKMDESAEFLVALNPDAIGFAPMNKIFKTLDDSAQGLLNRIAEKQGSTVDEILESISARAGGDLDTRLPRHLSAVQYLRAEAKAKNSDLEMLPLNFTQLVELRRGVGNLASSAAKSNKGAAANAFLSIRTKADSAFTKFVVQNEDGARIPAGNLMADVALPDGSVKTMSVSDALKFANQNYTQFMKRYRDDGLIRSWMGFDDFKNGARVRTTANADTPMGMDYGKNPTSSWINVRSWSQKSIEQQREDMKSLSDVFGETQTDGTKRINIDSNKGKAFQQILAAHYRKFLLDELERGNIQYSDIEQVSRNFEAAFTGVNYAGTEVRLIDTDKAFNQFLGFSEGTVGKDNWNRSQQLIKSAAQNEKNRVVREVNVIKQGLDSSVKFLQNYSSERVDATNLAKQLISGGPVRVSQLRKHLKETGKMTDDDVSLVLRNVLSEAIEVQVMKPTGVYTPQVGSGKVVENFEVDLNALNTLLGRDSPEVATAVKEIVGPEAYETYTNVLKFMSEQQRKRNSEGLSITGVPRDFSIESYISRFYAINRGVVSFRYVGTEAILQQMRNNNMSLLTQMMQNPKVGALFVEMVATGRPLPAQKEKELFQMLVVGFEKFNSLHSSQKTFEVPTNYDGEDVGYNYKYTSNNDIYDNSLVP